MSTIVPATISRSAWRGREAHHLGAEARDVVVAARPCDMNSMAQQAVPNGNGQKELRVDQSSSVSNVVVTQLSPIIFSWAVVLSQAASLPLVTGGHKLVYVVCLPGVRLQPPRSPAPRRGTGRPSPPPLSTGPGRGGFPGAGTVCLRMR